MYYDELLTKYLGDAGRYQVFIFLLVAVIGFPVAFNTMGIVFIAAVPEHWCSVPEVENLTLRMNLTTEEIKNLTLPSGDKTDYSQCHMFDANYSTWSEDDVIKYLTDGVPPSPEVPCKHGWSYSTDVYTSTAVSEWDLVCDSSVWITISTSSYMAGFMAGSLIAGNLSDRYGRRPVYIPCLILLIVSSVSLSFSPNFVVFFVIRFLTALFNIGASNAAYVIATEIMGPSGRAHAANAYNYFWAVGYLLFALFAFFIRNWRILQFVTSISCLPLIVSVFFLPESPRWLYSKNKGQEGDKIMHKMAKWNKRALPEKFNVSVKTNNQGYIWDLFRTPRLRVRTLIVMSIWCVTSFVYYGLSLNTSNLGGNDFVNFALAAGVEIPAYICCQLALTYIGRRLPLVASMIIGGLALMAITLIPPDLDKLTVGFAIFGKFCLTAAFSIVGVVTLEVFPTVTRQAGLATGSFAARVGGITAPYVTLLNKFGNWVPMVVFGSLSVAVGLLTLLLPETRGLSMPDTVEEGEQLGLKTMSREPNDEERSKCLDDIIQEPT